MPSPEVATLSRLIGYPTVSNRPVRELAAYVADRCERIGFRVEVFEDDEDPTKANVVCSAGPEGEDGLILSGHMDVVPVEGQSWSSDPFTLTERDGRLFGRGTSDMKGFIAASLEALERVEVRALRRPLVLIWTHDEEVGCHGSARLVGKLAGRPLPREALIGEPTDFNIFRMHPGHVTLQIITRGEAAHSSKPDLGASAIKAMARVLVAVEDLEEALRRARRLEFPLERPYVTMNAGVLRGGQAVNIVPDRCELTLGYRPLPGDSDLAVAELLRQRLDELTLPSGTSVSLEVLRRTPAMLSPEGLPLQGLLTPHACSPRTAASAFATDGGNFEKIGVRSLIFGPGSIDVAHRADEYVDAAALHRAVDVVAHIVADRCL